MTQADALDILKTGANVFLTGEPGAGKTHVLNEYTAWLEDCDVSVAVTASTGIAATHIGGMTIHSWSGVGVRDTLSQYDLDFILGKENVVKRIKKASVLVIDEISMLDGNMLEMVERVCRAVRGRADAFGGLQVVLVGDFYQLPPIGKPGEAVRFAFESSAWQSAKFLTCYITEQHRHEDEMLSALLSSIRRGEVEEEHYTLLGEQTTIDYEHIEPTRLFTHNKDVDSVNLARLGELGGKRATYKMESRGRPTLVESLKRNCLSPEVLELRLDAMVMCTKNSFEQGFVNGTLGRVVSLEGEDGFPVIETGDGRRITMAPLSWGIEENGKVVAEVIQVPLRLAWAITIHKSQGMSLDAAEIDLRNAFTYGQGYVALSRVRTLAGMKILGLNANALMVDPKIIKTDERFREDSLQAEAAFEAMDEEELTKMHEQFVRASGGKIPADGAAKREQKTFVERENTLEETRKLLDAGLSVPEVAKRRGFAVSTIWAHVEKMLELKLIAHAELDRLAAHIDGWSEVYGELRAAMDECGTEKLKPIYEATGERYDYDVVRLGRMVYLYK